MHPWLFSDNAYACDPRIQKFKEEEKEKKLAQKRAKQEAARQRAEEEEKVRGWGGGDGGGGNQAAASVSIEIVRGAYGFYCQIPYPYICRKAWKFCSWQVSINFYRESQLRLLFQTVIFYS